MVAKREAQDFIMEKLSVTFHLRQTSVRAVDAVSLLLPKEKVTSIIGESGCGKSVLVKAILGLLPNYACCSGHIFYGETELLNASAALLGQYRGKAWSLIPQLPGAAFNPVRKIGKHFTDVIQATAVQKNLEDIRGALQLFGLEETEKVLAAYPHELSGGMLQRILCALAVIAEPQWILADEPTKGLDEKNAVIALNNLQQIKQHKTKSMAVITHDVSFAQNFSDFIVVMYQGAVMEINADMLQNPLHPYTQFFLKALPESGFTVMPPAKKLEACAAGGCKFATRCPYCRKECINQEVPFVAVGANQVRCILYA